MNFELNEEQEMFRHSVRDFLAKECPNTLVREIENNRSDYSLDIYNKMAHLGWLGLMIPDKYGGTGGDWVNAAIFYEEAGRALLQSPHLSTVIQGGQFILEFGGGKQRSDLLPRITRGELVLAIAVEDAELISSPHPEKTVLSTDDNNNNILNGTKLFVSYAHLADYTIVSANRENSYTGCLLLVGKSSPGLSFTTYDTISDERVNDVYLNNVPVTEEAIICEEMNKGKINEIMDNARLLLCAYALGAAQASLDMLINYSRQRVLFGRPIGAFQALQHKMADIAIEIESARLLIYTAAFKSNNGIPCYKERAMAQLYIRQTYPHITEEIAHCHGAVALVKDHDMTLYYRKIKAIQLKMKFADYYNDLIADEILI